MFTTSQVSDMVVFLADSFDNRFGYRYSLSIDRKVHRADMVSGLRHGKALLSDEPNGGLKQTLSVHS